MNMTSVKGTREIVKDSVGYLEPLLREYLTNKEVLDLGCLSFSLRGFEINSILHLIKEISSYCVGVDIEKDILKLKDKGYNVVHSDVYELNLRRRFDVVFAGEFIEHLDNHSKFLKVAAKHLKDNGLLILTTPNPYFIGRNLEIWTKKIPYVSDEHYCYFCPVTLQKLLEDNGFKVIDHHWINSTKKCRVGYLPIMFRPYFSSNFMMIARKKGKFMMIARKKGK